MSASSSPWARSLLPVHAAATFLTLGACATLLLTDWVVGSVYGADGAILRLLPDTRTIWMVGGLLLIEALTGIALLARRLRPAGLPVWMSWIGIGLLVAGWLLAYGTLRELCRETPEADRLQQFELLRLGVWSVRGALVGWMLARTLPR